MAAGQGFKTFATGDVLTASDVNGYLMQGVWVFASAAARDAAVTSPQQGNMAYTKDTNTLWKYTGSAWSNAGGSSSPLTTKGDVWGYSTTDARIPIGTNGQVLTADSTQALGLKWATPATATSTYFANPILNSSMNVWQRGTSISLSASTTWANAYTTDRWNLVTGASQACTVARQATNDTTNLPNIQYCARVQRNSGQTGTGALNFVQAFESINSIRFAGQSVTLSFYARAGSNYSATSSALSANLVTGTGTDQQPASYTGSATPVSGTATLTTTWQRFSYSGTIASTATELYIQFGFTPTGTASTNDYYEITGIQLEIGSSATTYYPSFPTYQAELAACQRYYERNTTTSLGNIMFSAGFGASSTNIQMSLPCLVVKRVAPTTIEYANLAWANGISSVNISAATINSASPYSVFINATTTGATGGNAYALANNGSGTSYTALNSEI